MASEVVVIVQHDQAMVGCGRADQEISDRHRPMQPMSHQSVLRRLDPSPRRLRHRRIGVELVEHRCHLLVLVHAASRPAELGALGMARPDGAAHHQVSPCRSQRVVAHHSP
jgi:hypothetical protein